MRKTENAEQKRADQKTESIEQTTEWMKNTNTRASQLNLINFDSK